MVAPFIQPQSFESVLRQAVTHHQAGRLQEAERLYRSVLQTYPNHPDVNHSMGMLAMQLGLPVSGLPYFEKAWKNNPANEQFCATLVDCLLRLDRPDDALRIVKNAVQRKGFKSDQVRSLLLLAQNVVSGQHPLFSVEHEVLALFNAQNYGALEAATTSLTKRYPNWSMGWQLLGFALLSQDKDGLTALRRVVELNPANAEGYYNLGLMLNRQGQAPEAEACYRRALEIRPDYVDACCHLCMMLDSQDRISEAEASYRHILEIKPDCAEAYNNLGFIFQKQGSLVEAEASYRRAIQIRPDFVEAYNNLGNNLGELGRLDEAEACCRRAIQIRPDYAEAHNNLAIILQGMNRLEEAEASYRRATQIKPDYADVYGNLGGMLKEQGRLDEALACFKQQISLAGDNSIALHHVASLTGSHTERAPTQYIENIFDGYADKFDTHLVQVLNYGIPEKLVALISEHSTPPAEKWSVLDLGCGTGLVGLEIAPFTRQLIGVDLSSRMLEKAQARNLYQRLENSDLFAMMCGEPASSYDVIIAADVFVYLGKLDEIIGEAKRLLSPSGVLAFSIESMVELGEEDPKQNALQKYQLENTGRYTHSTGYIARLASDNGFSVKKMLPAQIRMEHGKPVNGYIALWENEESQSRLGGGSS